MPKFNLRAPREEEEEKGKVYLFSAERAGKVKLQPCAFNLGTYMGIVRMCVLGMGSTQYSVESLQEMADFSVAFSKWGNEVEKYSHSFPSFFLSLAENCTSPLSIRKLVKTKSHH